jgi:hypothetical protein
MGFEKIFCDFSGTFRKSRNGVARQVRRRWNSAWDL